MYSAHRGMVPAPANRLNELLDQVRAEFDTQQSRTDDYEQRCEFARYLIRRLSEGNGKAHFRGFVSTIFVSYEKNPFPFSSANTELRGS